MAEETWSMQPDIMSKSDRDFINSLPERVRGEVEKNIHDYIEQVRKDYPSAGTEQRKA